MSAERSPAEHWLHHFPNEHQDKVTSWFRHARTQPGLQTPDALVGRVTVLVGHALEWATTDATKQLGANLLTALRCARGGALAFAEQVLREG